MNREEVVHKLAEEGCLVSDEVLEEIGRSDLEKLRGKEEKPFYINRKSISDLRQADEGEERDSNIEIVKKIELHKEERQLEHFVENMNSKFEKLKELILKRRSMKGTLSIHRARENDEGQEVSVIGIVCDKYETKKGKYIVYIEDTTSQIKLLVSKQEGEKIVVDEVIGVQGNLGSNIIFADRVLRPSLPIPQDVSSFNQESYAAFISDIHFGSKEVLQDELNSFKQWLQSGNGQADNVKYLFVAGDIVEGVGVYPDQDQDLAISDIYQQYQQFSDFVRDLPPDIEIIVGPGNHDIVRRAEPQPPLPDRVFDDLEKRPNVYLTSNPSTIKIHDPDSEQSLRILMYHGTSFDSHTDSLSYLRQDAYQNPKRAMVDLLERRHLAPSYGKDPLAPESEDHMVIEQVPDVFVMGHIHSHTCGNYKGVNLICSSTFQGQTDYQKRIGHVPDPAKVTLLNLKTRKMRVKSFKR